MCPGEGVRDGPFDGLGLRNRRQLEVPAKFAAGGSHAKHAQIIDGSEHLLQDTPGIAIMDPRLCPNDVGRCFGTPQTNHGHGRSTQANPQGFRRYFHLC